MGWKDHLKKKSEYYKKKKENSESQSSDLSKGIVYVPKDLIAPGSVFSFFLVPHIRTNELSVTRGLHWMGKGKRSVRCPIFCRQEQDYIPDPEANENILDAISRAFDDPNGPRCAWCELNLAAYQMDDERVIETTFGSNYKENRSVSLRVDFFIIPFDKVFGEEPPDCFAVEKPDFNDNNCKNCEWVGECFLEGMTISVLEKTQGVEQQLIRAIEQIEAELDDPDDDILDLENAVRFNLETVQGKRIEYDISTGMKRYNVAAAYKKRFGEDIYEMLESAWPEDKHFFVQSHTYLEMMNMMSPREKKCLLSFLKESGKEVPGMVIDEDDSEDQEVRRPRRSKRIRRTDDSSDNTREKEDDSLDATETEVQEDESVRGRRRRRVSEQEIEDDDMRSEKRKRPRRSSSEAEDDDGEVTSKRRIRFRRRR